MAETRENHCCDWNSLPDGIWEDIASRFDLLSTVRLAVCSTSMYRLLIHSRPELFQTPCLLMPDLAEWPVDNLHDEREQTVVPLDMKKIPANLPFMPGQYWAGMNSRWIAIVSESGRSWCLVDVYSQRVIELPSLMAAKIGPRSPPPNPATYARAGTTWIDLRFLKIVVCEVPTASGEYEDYKLIGLFNRGLAYLETSCHQWRWLTVHPVYPPWLSDAIEHAIIVYAVDSDLGCTYCWDTSLLGAKCLPYVIPPPLEEERYGVWFLARSADGQRLMIIRTYVPDHLISTNYIDYMDRDIRDYPGFGCHVFEKDPSSVGPGVFLWRQEELYICVHIVPCVSRTTLS